MMLFRALRGRLLAVARGLVVLGVLLSLVLNTAIPAYAAGGENGSLRGTVIDGTTKAPVPGAKIAISSPSGTYRATTDTQGTFNVNGIPVDTYLVSIEAAGYEAVTQNGITIQGDQTVDLGQIVVSKLRTIVNVKVRSAAGAYQPGQTTDSFTINSARQQEVLGKSQDTNENQLLLSVPGTSTTDTGRVTIRGGLSNEVGYQLDGVPYTEPFLSMNASAGNINGVGSVQVVEGPGDATQGNIGSGLVNVIPKRGTYPGSGTLDFEVGGPNFDHQFAVDYGIATRSGNISNYFSYLGYRAVPYIGYFNSNPGYNGNANFTGGTGLQYNDDLIDNFVIRFGKDNRQSLNVLYNTRDLQDYGQIGGLTGRESYVYDPYVLAHGSFVGGSFGGNPFAGANGVDAMGNPTNPAADLNTYHSLIGLIPGTGAANNQQLQHSVIDNEVPTSLLKFEYSNNLDDKTFLQLRYYNLFSFNNTNNAFESATDPNLTHNGGERVGTNFELTRTVGKHTLTLQAQLENQKPIWNNYDPTRTLVSNSVDGLSLTDYLPGGIVYDTVGGGHRLPLVGINYNQADFQTEGAGIRDQWIPSDFLKLDYGIRVDHANYKYGENPYNPTDLGNPSDVPPNFLRYSVLHPNVFEPRIAVSLQPTRNDTVRASYGRSVEFLNAQTAGTPGGMYGASFLDNVPVAPKTNTADPSTWTCGTGLNPVHAVASKANVTASGGAFFRCNNYAQQLFWAYDQNFDAPDLGNGTSPTYNNYDLSYSHQFRNGFGMKATGFYRLSTGLPGFFVLSQTTDPATGQITSQVFSVNNNAIQRTTGAEFNVTTPERPVGFSGFFSATYQNAISSIPPLLNGEDTLPLVTTQSFLLNDTYRAGFLSPFVADFGGTYRTKAGFRITPDVQFNAGYPTGVGNLLAFNGYINGKAYNVTQTNLGGAQPTANAFNNATGASVATNYVDPAYPGSYLNPNIAATRGTRETSAAGGILSRPSFLANLTAEYTFAKRNTIGLQVNNLFGNIYVGNVPIANTYYQPVTTGVAGPVTGTVTQANPAQTSYANHGFTNVQNSVYGQNAYLLLPNAPTTYRVYYQLGL